MPTSQSPVPPLAVIVSDTAAPPTADLVLGDAEDGSRYNGAFVIATDGGVPCGAFTIATGEDGRIGSAELAERVATAAAASPPSARAAAVTDTPLISVVICVTDGGRRAGRAIESLLACEYPATEIVVVNNRPENGPLALEAATAGDADVRIVDEPRAGLSAARNRGAAAASGELLLFTDDDVVVMPGLLSAVAAAFAAHPEASCVTGLILPLRLETNTQLQIERFAGFSKGFEPAVFTLDENLDDRTFPYAAGQFGSGANIAIRRTAFDQLGGFDEALGSGTPARGGEDTDLFIRLMFKGHELVYEPAATVLHEHPSRPEQLRSTVYNYGVGTTAPIAKELFFGRRRGRLLRAMFGGLAIALSPRSHKNRRKGKGFPMHHSLRELGGMAYGPWAYLRSRRAHRRALPGPRPRD
jgi:GT2 family glycosyltransferase